MVAATCPRVQVPNNHILAQNLYYNYYYPKLKYLIIGYLDPLGCLQDEPAVRFFNPFAPMEPWTLGLGFRVQGLGFRVSTLDSTLKSAKFVLDPTPQTLGQTHLTQNPKALHSKPSSLNSEPSEP